MDESAEQTKVEWREWGPDAFTEAQDEDKPVLLSLSATWCSWCHQMDREAYSNPMVAANVNDSFVPVRVDIDRQPRVRERYNMGGFPSNVFATPEGELLTGATYLETDGMRQIVERIRDLWTHKGRDAARVPRSLREKPPEGEVTEEIERLVGGQLDEKYDADFGGWGDSQKFPMPRTIEFALKRERQQARSTLAAIQNALLDDYDGGFFRFAEGQDWSEVHHEKLLSTNAALVRAFAEGYLYTGEEEYHDAARQTVEYLTTTLWNDERDAFAGSQAPGEDYYERDPSDRETTESPPVDQTVFADWNAMAVDALLTFSAYTDDERARNYAERALDSLLDELVEDGEVTHFEAVAESDEASESGLLADHANLLAALTTAQQVLGGDRYLDVAERVADHAIETLQLDGGAFVDGPDSGPGMLDRPMRPLDDNAEMAIALVDLALLTGDEDYQTAAEDALAAFAGAADRFGVQVANYATAAARVCQTPLTIEVADDAGSDLHRAALRMADHEKVVVPDATSEDDTIEDGSAYVVRDGERSSPATTPDELSSLVADGV
ncbi:DUF255 domain-containing protein [Halorussus halophilus]|uniref:DUF255 domain-containing protein n=1 Tax=Halorussus halophilus TaxID=2650975 RepID=UPI001300D842|nr:DUF255 domain-containing protein [Halorussus halophilus]